MASNFTDILDRPATEIRRPPTVPVGEYLYVITRQPEHGKSDKKGTPYVKFFCRILQAYNSVDPEALEEFTKLTPLNDVEMELTFYTTEKSGYRLKDFLVDDLQIDDEGGTRSLRAMIPDSVGCQFMGSVKHTPSEDQKGVYANISKTAPVD